jgi:hypothetical protein
MSTFGSNLVRLMAVMAGFLGSHDGSPSTLRGIHGFALSPAFAINRGITIIGEGFDWRQPKSAMPLRLMPTRAGNLANPSAPSTGAIFRPRRRHGDYGQGSVLQPLTATSSNTNNVLDDDENEEGRQDPSDGMVLNPLYFVPWVGFLAYAVLVSPGEMLDGTDTALIRSFLDDPTNNSGSINPLFFVVFNMLGIMPIVLAALVLPQGSNSKTTRGLWAGPFLLGSAAAGYGSLGLYLSFRPPPVRTKTRSDLSWPTRNIFENKIVNWAVVGLSASLLFTSGILPTIPPAGNDDGVVDGFLRLASTSKLVSVSSLDLVLLTAAAATLIPGDYRLRTNNSNNRAAGEDDDDDERSSNIVSANLVGVSTVLLPVVGAALYCALRPPLPED